MNFISPRELYDDPKLWLSVPHSLHSSLEKLLDKLTPGFSQKLVDEEVHCYLCEGTECILAHSLETFSEIVITGHVGTQDNILLYRTEPTSEPICANGNEE